MLNIHGDWFIAHNNYVNTCINKFVAKVFLSTQVCETNISQIITDYILIKIFIEIKN